MPPAPYPLRLEPYLSRPLWGGEKLAARYGKGGGSGGTIGESWEIYEGDAVQNGAYAGKTLGELTEVLGEALLGTAARGNPRGRFPLLIKLIDAQQQLSIQVHPNDQQAQELEHEPFGKTEAWYILDAEPGAKLVYGLAHPLRPEELRERSAAGTVEADLAYLAVAPGDVVLVPAGTIHAIGAGILLYEIQQTSATTYRLYDWNRVGPDGKKRELHLDKAVRVANLAPGAQGKQRPKELGRAEGAERQELVRSPYFVLERALLDGRWTCRPGGETFLGLTCVAGGVALASPSGAWPEERLAAGASALLPADLDACTLHPSDGQAEVLVARLPA
jgi:mannose-6-phosphate isomerase